jgi:hypothetical protein
LLAVISGLNISAVQRLRSTWEEIGSKYSSLYQELEELVSPNNNFAKYREQLAILEQEFVDRSGTTSLAKDGRGLIRRRTITTSHVNSPTMQPSRKSSNGVVIPIISLFLKDLLVRYFPVERRLT